MRSSQHRDELRKSREELAELLQRREEIEIEIARQKRKVIAWAEVCDEGEFSDSNMVNLLGFDLGGLADVCRTALRASRKEWMTIADIQAAIVELGFPLGKYKAPAASITTTINRLAIAGEVESRRETGEAMEYKWKSKFQPLYDALLKAKRPEKK